MNPFMINDPGDYIIFERTKINGNTVTARAVLEKPLNHAKKYPESRGDKNHHKIIRLNSKL